MSEIATATTASPTPENSATPTAPESELLMFEIVDERVCRLEWHGPDLVLAVDDVAYPLDPQRVLRLLEEQGRADGGTV